MSADRWTDAERVENQRSLLIAIVEWLKETGYPYDWSTSVLPPEPLRPLIEVAWAYEEPEHFEGACSSVAEEGGWLTDDWTAPDITEGVNQ